jgi:hypothetical protein
VSNQRQLIPTATEKWVDWIVERHGLLVPTAAVAALMGYGSSKALTEARRHQRLAFPLHSIPNRRGLYARATELAAYLAAIDADLEEEVSNRSVRASNSGAENTRRIPLDKGGHVKRTARQK